MLGARPRCSERIFAQRQDPLEVGDVFTGCGWFYQAPPSWPKVTRGPWKLGSFENFDQARRHRRSSTFPWHWFWCNCVSEAQLGCSCRASYFWSPVWGSSCRDCDKGSTKSCRLSVWGQAPGEAVLPGFVHANQLRETDLADFTVHSMSEGKLRLAFRNGKARQAAIAYLANTQPEGTVDVVNVPRGRRLQTEGFEPGAYLETGPLAKAITKSAFTKLVRDILTNVKSEAPRDGQDANSDTVRMESAALHTLKEVSETMLTRLFEDCQTFATHAKRKTIFVSDLTLAKRCHRWAKQCFYRGLDIAHCSLLLLQGRGSVIILWSWSGLSFVLGQSHDVNRFSWFLRRHHPKALVRLNSIY